jgi:transposase
MLTPADHQRSFYDADQVCESLIPPDSFYRKFREVVAPLITDDQFAAMYSPDTGRPAIPPSLLACATILQFHRNLSDREMERACRYDIEGKYALGLRLDERPFDHSSLGDFRQRLLANGKEKAIFDQILQRLVETRLIAKNEIQRIDATHILADIAIPTTITLITKGIAEVLKPLQKRHAATFQQLGEDIPFGEYPKDKITQEGSGRHDLERKKRKLVAVVADARQVLAHTQALTGDPILARRVETLRRILGENIEDDEAGAPREKPYKAKGPDLLVSPIDPDARYGAKSDTKHFTGYKANVTETVTSRFITNITATSGNRPDGESTVESVLDQRRHGLIPAKLIGDTAYSDGRSRKDLKAQGTELVAPLRTATTRTRARSPKRMFHYDRRQNTLTCPAGVTVQQTVPDAPRQLRKFHFPLPVCGACPRRPDCTQAKDGRRSVGISDSHEELRAAEAYNHTAAFKATMKLRPPIEGKLSELVRYHGLRRARYRTLVKVRLQCYFTAAAVNIKRWIALLSQKWTAGNGDPAPARG